jgi:FMN phosphatase YigB (HAD superfamily)
MDKLILTDVDGVLLDWESAFHDWMESQGFERNGIATYDMHVAYGQKKAHIKALIREFNNSAWMCCLEPLRDAVEGVATLALKGYRFGAITSLSLDPYAARLRKQNLMMHFGDVFDFVTCLDTGADKDEALAPFKDSGLFWIEDKPENAALGANLGLTSLLVAHPHNADFTCEGVKSVDNWAQIVEIIS